MEKRVHLALDALQKIYPKVDIKGHIIGDPITVSWEADPNFLGAFKGALCVIGVARQADGDIGGKAGGAGGGGDDGAVALDGAAAFEILHPAKAGRGRQPDPRGKLQIRDAAVAFEDTQYLRGNRVYLGFWLCICGFHV